MLLHPKPVRTYLTLVFFLCSAFALSHGRVASAAGLLDTINNNLASDTSGFFAGSFLIADALFGFVAFFVIITTLANYVGEHRTGSGLGVLLLRTILSIGFPFAFLKAAETFLPNWLAVALSFGQTITSQPLLSDPDSVFGEGANLAKTMLVAVGQVMLNNARNSGLNVGQAVVYLLMAVVAIFGAVVLLVTFSMLAVEMLVAFAQGYIAISIGAFQLGWSASKATNSFAASYWGLVMNSIIRIIVTMAVIAIGMKETGTWVTQITAAGALDPTKFGSSILTLLQIPMMGVVFLFLAIKVTALATSQLSGQPAFSATSAAAGRAGSVVGGAAGMMAGGIGGGIAGGAMGGLRGGITGAVGGAYSGSQNGGSVGRRQASNVRNS